MSTKLYVGNLSFNTSSQDLEQIFAEAGTVQSANIVEDRETGRSRGFGFVEMSSKEEAQTAISSFDGKEIDGRKVWKGGLAYYIQSYVYDGQSTDDATDIATDAVLPADNSPETMHEFEQACLTLAPTAINGN